MSRQVMVVLLPIFWVVPLSALVYPHPSNLKATGDGNDDVGQQGFRNDHWSPCNKAKKGCFPFGFCWKFHQVATDCEQWHHGALPKSKGVADSFEGQFPSDNFQSEEDYLSQAEEASPVQVQNTPEQSWVPSVPSFTKPHKKKKKEEDEDEEKDTLLGTFPAGGFGGGFGGWGSGWGGAKGFGSGWGGGKHGHHGHGGWFR